MTNIFLNMVFFFTFSILVFWNFYSFIIQLRKNLSLKIGINYRNKINKINMICVIEIFHIFITELIQILKEGKKSTTRLKQNIKKSKISCSIRLTCVYYQTSPLLPIKHKKNLQLPLKRLKFKNFKTRLA